MLFLAFLGINEGAAQNNLKLSSEGSIPRSFGIPLLEKTQTRLQSIPKRKPEKWNEEFIKSTSYSEDYFNRSGKLIFKTSLNEYLDEVVGLIIQSQNFTLSQPEVFIVESPAFNAWTNYKGNIYVSIGLLSKIRSEAELSFVLCHELSHHLKLHVKNDFLEERKSEENKEEYKDLNYSKKLRLLSTYSKKQEIEADSLGFQMYINLNYDRQSILDLFEFMHSSQVNDNLDHLSEYLLQTTNYNISESDPNLRFEDSLDTTYSSHPSPLLRKSILKNLILEEMPSKGDSSVRFLISEARFNAAKERATNELSRIYLENRHYEMAISNSFYLIDHYSVNENLELLIGHALTQISICKSNRDFGLLNGLDGYFKSSLIIHSFFKEIDNQKAGIMAINYIISMMDKYPNSDEWESLLQLSVRNLVFNLHIDSSEQLRTLDLNESPKFYDTFDLLIEEKAKEEAEKKELIQNAAKRKAIAERNKQLKKNGFALGIDRIVVVNPQSISREFDSSLNLEFDESEKIRSFLIGGIDAISKQIDLNTTILDLSLIPAKDIVAYNDYCALSSWFNEKTNHPSDNYYVFNKKYVGNAINRYETPYFAWIAFKGVKEQYKVVDKQNSVIDLFLFDIPKNQIILSQREWINGKVSEKKLNNALTKLLTQIKTKTN